MTTLEKHKLESLSVIAKNLEIYSYEDLKNIKVTLAGYKSFALKA